MFINDVNLFNDSLTSSADVSTTWQLDVVVTWQWLDNN